MDNLKTGESLIITKDTEAVCMTYYAEPGFGERDIVVPRGEKIIISDLELNIKGYICCDLINYDKYHKVFVSEAERNHSHYGGYFLLISRKLLLNNSVRALR